MRDRFTLMTWWRFFLALTALAAAGCATDTPAGTQGAASTAGGPLEAATLLEQARTKHYHRGEHQQALDLCREVEASPLASDLTRTEALVFRAELQAYLGDREGAIGTLEDHMHRNDRLGTDIYPGEQKVSEMLARLLNGWDFDPDFIDAEIAESGGVVAEIAAMLPCEGRLQKYSFATHSRQNVVILNDAISKTHYLYCEELFLGEDRAMSDSHSTSQWTLIPYVIDKLDRSMAVYVHDAAAHPIPRHYADLLPCSYDELESHIQHNQGFVAVDQKYGLPRILIAAPDNPGVLRTIHAFMELESLPEDGRFVLDLAERNGG